MGKKKKTKNGIPAVATKEFAHMLAKKVSCSQKDGEIIVNAFLDLMLEVVANGTPLIFYNFGSFVVKQRKERKGIDTNGNECLAKPYKALVFKQSKWMKDILANDGEIELGDFLNMEGEDNE